MIHSVGYMKYQRRVVTLLQFIVVQLTFGIAFKPIPLVRPSQNSKLVLDPEGLQYLNSIKHTVAPVVVIGPYRSGKSFLLNQLVQVGCGEGFGVGHTRAAETKGVWVWGEPIPASRVCKTGCSLDNKEQDLHLLYIDTEGLEGTGRSEGYDDRIFTLAALLSSVLLYNLQQAIKESDVQKLAFAVELARGFYGQVNSTSYDQFEHSALASPLSSTAMIWVVQQDFLLGNDLQHEVEALLKPVPNAENDPYVKQVNNIRKSLHFMAGSTHGIGLPLPHVNRTQLCQLPDTLLDANYRSARDRLRGLVAQVVRGKQIGGAAVNGAELATFLKQLVTGLNEKEIPTAASLVSVFNIKLVERVVAKYKDAVQHIGIPIDEQQLNSLMDAHKQDCLKDFKKGWFGGLIEENEDGSSNNLYKQLLERISEESRLVTLDNQLKSEYKCKRIDRECEKTLQELQNMVLPSIARFEAKGQVCIDQLNSGCIGPSRKEYKEHVDGVYNRERSQFMQGYNYSLLKGLLIGAIILLVVGRFILHWKSIELLGWAIMIALMILPRFLAHDGALYNTRAWHVITACWESIVYNSFIDVGSHITLILVLLVGSVLGCRYRNVWVRVLRSSACGQKLGGLTMRLGLQGKKSKKEDEELDNRLLV